MKLPEIDNLTNKQQDRMCELCETHILGCKHSTATFLCEGSMCDNAFELLMNEYREWSETMIDKTEPNNYYLLIKK